MMNKDQKKNYITEMTSKFENSKAVMVTHYQGLTMVQLDELRAKMRDHGIIFKITKNRITKIAIKETPVKDLEKYFTGPTAAAISSDPISTAKILTKFAKTHGKLKIIAGFMDGKVLDQKEVAIIATLPTLEEARAKIVGILATPAQKLISILLAPGSKIANLARAKSLKN
jgi:large subunit ribosomal protein L10